MAGFSDALESQILNSVLRSVAWTAIPGVQVTLYTSDPGDAGTSNEATSSSRQTITFEAPSSGICINTSEITFTGLATLTISHVGLWSTDASPVFLFGGALSASKSVSSGSTGGTFIISSGSLSVTLT